jgi:hypothetical protein
MLSIRSLFRLTAVLLVLGAALAACRRNDVLPAGGNPIPTPRIGENVGSEPGSQAAGTPEETVGRYLRDSIAAQVAIQQTEVIMRERYQDPSLTAKALSGLVTEIAVLEDHSTITRPKENVANAHVSLDIRVKFANGDTDTRTCRYEVNMQRGQNSKGQEVWYVITPDAFPVFASCTSK